LRLDSVLSDGQVNAVHSYANHGVALTLRSSAILVKPCGPNVLLTWMIGKLRRQISLHWEIVHQMSPSCLIKNSYSSGANLATLSKSRIWVPGLPSPFGTKEGSFHQRPSQSFNSCCFANHKKHPNSKCSRVGSCSSKPRTRGSMIWPSATKIFRSNSANVICHTTPFC
jgi:hypothetical protein